MTEQQNHTSSIGKRIYPLRFVGYVMAIICIIVFQKDTISSFSTADYLLMTAFFVYPHLAFLLYLYKKQDKRIEMVNLALDMFWIACISYLLDFTIVVFIPYAITNSATNFSLGGIKLFFAGLVTFAIGVGMCYLFMGEPHAVTQTNPYSFIPSYIYLFFGVHYIGFLSYSLGTSARDRKKQIEIQNDQLQSQSNELMTLNEEINQQNEEISSQRDSIQIQSMLLEEKNSYLTKSINYAKRIQEAILPPESIFSSFFSDYFVFFKPKDSVSGDFYWAKQIGADKLIFAVADCTGHGVPGAFMSLIAQSLLNEIVVKEQNPAKILEELQVKINLALHQKTSNNKDGLEIALCSCFLQKNQLEINYAAAGIPLVKVCNGKMEIIKSSKVYIGGFIHQNKKVNNTIVEHTIVLQRGDSIYLYSDGCPDQFGGEKNKKYSRKRLHQLVEETNSFTKEEQLQKIDTTFKNWQEEGREKQTDDMVLVGLKY